MPNLNAGQTTTLHLQIGGKLFLTASSGGRGSVVRLATSNGGEPYSPVAYVGDALVFGPFDAVTPIKIECNAGQLPYSATTPAITDADAHASIFTKTLNSGQQSSVYVPAGSVLRVPALSTSRGSLVPIDDSFIQTPIPYLGSELIVGPFNELRVYRVYCDVGPMVIQTGWQDFTLGTLTHAVAFATLPTDQLKLWHLINSGPTVAITKTLIGNRTINSQADADALIGAKVIGYVIMNYPAELHDCIIEAPSYNAQGTLYMIYCNVPAANGAIIRNCLIDGNDGILTFGISGLSSFSSVTILNNRIERCGQDPVRGGRLNIFRYNMIWKVRVWDTVRDGPYNFNVNVHTDGAHVQRDGSIFQYNWIDDGVGENCTSGFLITPIEVFTVGITIEKNYLDGGGHVMHLHSNGDVLEDPGRFWWPKATYKDNRVGKNNKNYKTGSSPWAVGSVPSSYLTASGNIWSEDFTPVPAPPVIAEPFTPYSLAGLGYPSWWFDAEWDASLTLDGSNFVQAWADRINGVTFAQATAANQPLYSDTGYNSRPVVTFDGVDDFMELAAHVFPSGATPGEIWAVVNQTALPADTTSRDVFDYGGGVTVSRRLRRVVASAVNRAAVQNGLGASSTSLTNGSGDLSGLHVMRAVFDGTNVSISIDGGTANSAASVPATAAGTRARIGCSDSAVPAGFWQGGVNSIVVVNGALTAPIAAQMLAYLNYRRN